MPACVRGRLLIRSLPRSSTRTRTCYAAGGDWSMILGPGWRWVASTINVQDNPEGEIQMHGLDERDTGLGTKGTSHPVGGGYHSRSFSHV